MVDPESWLWTLRDGHSSKNVSPNEKSNFEFRFHVHFEATFRKKLLVYFVL